MHLHNLVSALSALSIALAIGFPTVTQAQLNNLDVRQTALHRAVCAQEWTEAIALLDNMVGSPQISAEDHQKLLDYRPFLVEMENTNIEDVVVMGCGVGSLGRTEGSTGNWHGAVQMIRTFGRERWSGHTVGRGQYDFERWSGGSSSGSSSGNGGSSSGNCNNPDDIAADGSRCGDRAASVRAGGQ
jgi:uncharacterized membrane protein YgcG